MKLSVAMCTYNGADFIQAQLESIAEQTLQPDELIVVDDCSTDDTVRLVYEFKSSTRIPVHVTVNGHQLGSTKNFEKAIRLCTGDIIALADQDDVWRSDKLIRIEQHFAAHPQIGIIFSDAEIVDQHLRSLNRRLWQEIGFDHNQKQLLRRNALQVLLPGWTITGATMAFRSAFNDIVLPIPTDIGAIHDGWIGAMIAAVAEVDFIDDTLIKYRQHPQQQIGLPKRDRNNEQVQEKKLLALHEALRRRHSYVDLIGIGNKIHERLVANKDYFDRKTLAEFESRIEHLNTRANLPSGTFSRLNVVLREFFTLRYFRYSKGLASMAKDLVSPQKNNAHL